MEHNVKIVNATPIIEDGIKFRSKLERAFYRALLSKGVNPKYEGLKITVWDRPKDYYTVPYFDRVGSAFRRVVSKPISVHYTPDFIFDYKKWTVYLEVKGFKNDVAPYKIRLFRDKLEKMQELSERPLLYAVVYNLKELDKLFDTLDNEEIK